MKDKPSLPMTTILLVKEMQGEVAVTYEVASDRDGVVWCRNHHLRFEPSSSEFYSHIENWKRVTEVENAD